MSDFENGFLDQEHDLEWFYQNALKNCSKIYLPIILSKKLYLRMVASLMNKFCIKFLLKKI
jgi:hypothetical protein